MHPILPFVIYAWAAGSSLLLIASVILQLRTDSFDPRMRLYEGMTLAALISIVGGVGLTMWLG